MPEIGKEVLMDLQKKTIIFDLDGTLADTSGDLIAAANYCFSDMGYGAVLDPGVDAPTALRGGRAMLRLGLSKRNALDERVVDHYYPVLLDAYDTAIAEHTCLFPKVREVIQWLSEAGYILGICTNKPVDLAEKLMRAIEFRDPFLSLIGADSLPVRKPDPRPFVEAVTRAGGRVERSCLIGDSITDHTTARAAGVPSVLVDFGLADQDMAALEPDALITSFEDLPKALANLGL